MGGMKIPLATKAEKGMRLTGRGFWKTGEVGKLSQSASAIMLIMGVCSGSSGLVAMVGFFSKGEDRVDCDVDRGWGLNDDVDEREEIRGCSGHRGLAWFCQIKARIRHAGS